MIKMNGELNSLGGITAAMATAVCWTTAAVIFQNTIHRTPNAVINFAKVFIALLFLIPTAWILRGHGLPLDIPLSGWLWLTASSWLGFVICDYLLFESFRLTGGRTAMVIFSLAPVFAALGGLFFLGEVISATGTTGIIITLLGIVIATAGKPTVPGETTHRIRERNKGIMAATLASVFQGTGYLLTKQGMQYSDSIGGTQIRLLAAIAGFAVILLLRRETGEVFRIWTQPKPSKQIITGSLVGTYLGMVLSLYALGHAPAGIVATIFALPPVLMIPATWWLYKEKINGPETAGALMAATGVAMLVAG